LVEQHGHQKNIYNIFKTNVKSHVASRSSILLLNLTGYFMLLNIFCRY